MSDKDEVSYSVRQLGSGSLGSLRRLRAPDLGTDISVAITADSYQTPAEVEAHTSLFSLTAAT